MPHSGNVGVRIDPDVHLRAAIAAEVAGKGLNRWTEKVLRQAAR